MPAPWPRSRRRTVSGMSDLNCPSCGSAVPHSLRYAKLVVCPTCQVSLFLEDDAVKNAGERSSVADDPSIFTLGQPFKYEGATFVPHGRIRYDYGSGYWDEWWVESDLGEASWVSVDEGDIAIQQPLALNSAAPAYESLRVGSTLSVGDETLKVTEQNVGTCIGFEGELPEITHVGEEHRYVHLSGPRGVLLTVEYDEDETKVFKGTWIDPFEVQTLS